MKLHKGINQTEIAVRYYERKGKNISREQAQKNFNLLRNPDMKLLLEIIHEVYQEAISEMTYELEQKGIHPSLPSTIEKGQKGYSMDSLIKYLNAILRDFAEKCYQEGAVDAQNDAAKEIREHYVERGR